jgi:hypothetical protein
LGSAPRCHCFAFGHLVFLIKGSGGGKKVANLRRAGRLEKVKPTQVSGKTLKGVVARDMSIAAVSP